MSEFQPLDLLPPWTAIHNAAALEEELAREVAKGHPLLGARASALARREDNDDVLFALNGGPAPFAVVHLTWSGTPEPAPKWPAFECYETISEWRERRMKPDHEE
jgi:hypothetical protein